MFGLGHTELSHHPGDWPGYLRCWKASGNRFGNGKRHKEF